MVLGASLGFALLAVGLLGPFIAAGYLAVKLNRRAGS
jgi:hypothetical protein